MTDVPPATDEQIVEWQKLVDEGQIIFRGDQVPALIARVRELDHSRRFHQRRMDEFQRWQKDLPEPYRTECCNILANGKRRA